MRLYEIFDDPKLTRIYTDVERNTPDIRKWIAYENRYIEPTALNPFGDYSVISEMIKDPDYPKYRRALLTSALNNFGDSFKAWRVQYLDTPLKNIIGVSTSRIDAIQFADQLDDNKNIELLEMDVWTKAIIARGNLAEKELIIKSANIKNLKRKSL